MAISTKGKRKITVNDQIFYWHIRRGKLTVISSNKQLIVTYELGGGATPLRIEKAPDRERLAGRNIRLKRENDEIRPKHIAAFIQQLLED